MVPEVLELRDFLSYRSPPPLDLRGVRAACLSGPNGHGKSALLDAITWALWGRARGCEGGQRQDRIIGDGADRAQVRLTFRHGDGRYRVTRRRDRKARGQVALEIETATGWSDSSGTNAAETDERLAGLLGIDYSSFVHSAYLVQGQASAFADLTPARRQELLARVLGIDNYAALADAARTRLRAEESRVARAEAERDAAAARSRELTPKPGEAERVAALVEASDADWAGANATVEQARQWAGRRAVLDERVAQVNAALVRLEREASHDRAEETRLRRELGNARAALSHEDPPPDAAGMADDEGAPQRLDELRSERADVAARLVEVETLAAATLQASRMALADAEREVLRLTAVEGSECPTCGGEVTPTAHTRLARARDEAAALVLGLETEAPSAGDAERRKVDALDEEIERLRRVVEWQRRREAANAYMQRAADIERSLTLVEERGRQHDAERARIGERQAAAHHERSQLGAMDADQAAEALATAARRRDAAREAATLLRSRAERATVEEARAAAAASLASEAAREADAFRRLADAFGRQGIPALVIDNAVPDIQAEANSLLDRLSDGALALTLDTRREGRNGAVSDTLDVTVWAGGHERDIALLSGGEAFRVSFALRVALSRLLARRAGTALEVLVVDEGFGSQDADGRARLTDALARVGADFELILVVTHVEELKEMLPTRIDVLKDPVHGSTARLVPSTNAQGLAASTR